MNRGFADASVVDSANLSVFENTLEVKRDTLAARPHSTQCSKEKIYVHVIEERHVSNVRLRNVRHSVANNCDASRFATNTIHTVLSTQSLRHPQRV